MRKNPKKITKLCVSRVAFQAFMAMPDSSPSMLGRLGGFSEDQLAAVHHGLVDEMWLVLSDNPSDTQSSCAMGAMKGCSLFQYKT